MPCPKAIAHRSSHWVIVPRADTAIASVGVANAPVTVNLSAARVAGEVVPDSLSFYLSLYLCIYLSISPPLSLLINKLIRVQRACDARTVSCA